MGWCGGDSECGCSGCVGGWLVAGLAGGGWQRVSFGPTLHVYV